MTVYVSKAEPLLGYVANTKVGDGAAAMLWYVGKAVVQ